MRILSSSLRPQRSLRLLRLCSYEASSGQRDAILTHAIKHVSLYGWTEEALARGAMDAGYAAKSTPLTEILNSFFE